MREILIKKGGFTRPGCSFFGDPVNESYEERKEEEECVFCRRLKRVTGRASGRDVDSSPSSGGVKVGPQAHLHC